MSPMEYIAAKIWYVRQNNQIPMVFICHELSELASYVFACYTN